MRVFKVIARGVEYGAFKTIEAARTMRNNLKLWGRDDIVITVSEEDVDPSNKIAGVDFNEALDKLTNLKL